MYSNVFRSRVIISPKYKYNERLFQANHEKDNHACCSVVSDYIHPENSSNVQYDSVWGFLWLIYSSTRKQSGYEKEPRVLFVQKELRSFMYYSIVSCMAKHGFACTGKAELCHVC